MSVLEWSWLATGLILLAGLTAPHSSRIVLAGPVAWSAVFLFAVSTTLANLYRIFPADEALPRIERVAHAVLLWQWHIVGLLLVYSAALVCLRDSRKWGWQGAALGWGLVSIFIAFTANSVEQQKAAEFVALCSIAALGLFCIQAIDRRDTIGRALWCVLVAGEGLAAITYFECQILFTWAAERGTTSACSRLFGESLQYIESTMMAPAWLYVFYRWFRPRRS